MSSAYEIEILRVRIGGVQPHFCPWKNMFFPIFPLGEKYSFPSLSIYFFPHGKKWENTHFSMGKNGVGPPPPRIAVSLQKK